MEHHSWTWEESPNKWTGGEGRVLIVKYARDFDTIFFISRVGINPNSYSGFFMGQMQS